MALSGYNYFSVVVLLSTAACSTLPPAAKEYDSFSAYAESVFRHQNDLLSRLMMRNDAEDNPELEDAEEAMNDACHLLNEYAEHEIEHESMSLFFKRKVQASIEECDKKIQQLEAMLTKTAPLPR